MSTKPILFSTSMVQAILDGRKTMTRRVIPEKIVDEYYDYDDYVNAVATGVPHIRDYEGAFFKKKARYQPGDILWVRETWGVGTRPHPMQGWIDGIEFKADEKYLQGDQDDLYLYHTEKSGLSEVIAKNEGQGWRPSIFMPREAARIFLCVKDVRAERVQDITHAGALAEGIPQCPGWKYELSECDCTVWSFAELWDSLNAKRGYGWDKNPWVWVYSFERVDKPTGWPGVEGRG